MTLSKSEGLARPHGRRLLYKSIKTPSFLLSTIDQHPAPLRLPTLLTVFAAPYWWDSRASPSPFVSTDCPLPSRIALLRLPFLHHHAALAFSIHHGGQLGQYHRPERQPSLRPSADGHQWYTAILTDQYRIETLTLRCNVPGLSLLGTLNAPLITDFLTNNVRHSSAPTYPANADGTSLCRKAFPGAPELQPRPIRMSSHPPRVRRSRLVRMPVF